MRSSYRPRRSENTGFSLLLVAGALLVLVAIGAVALTVYGGSLTASQQPVEQELPDARFPH